MEQVTIIQQQQQNLNQDLNSDKSTDGLTEYSYAAEISPTTWRE